MLKSKSHKLRKDKRGKRQEARQLELAAIKEREETNRHAEEEETKRQAHAHSQASTQQDSGDGIDQDQHCPSYPHLETRQTTSIHTFSALKHMPLR